MKLYYLAPHEILEVEVLEVSKDEHDHVLVRFPSNREEHIRARDLYTDREELQLALGHKRR